MADETYASTHRFIERGGPYDMGRTVTGEASIKPGWVIYTDSANLCYAAKNSDSKWSGVMALKAGNDIDTAVSISTKQQYYKKCGCRLNLISEATSPSVAIVEGDPIILGTEDGKVRRFAYAGDAGDTQDLVGWADEYLTPSVTDDKILGVRLVGGN